MDPTLPTNCTYKLPNNTTKVIKIKDTFSALNSQKINQIYRIINSSSKPKPCIQMTTKDSLRKQVIILMSNDNINKFMKDSSLHIANINQFLRNAKFEVLVDFIHSNISSITIVTNKVVVQSDLYIIKNYVKKVKDIDTVNMNILWLPQSKFYLKIIDILYFSHDSSNECLTLSEVERIIKQNQIFNNVVLMSKPHVIKVSPKSDILIIWIDIWDVQSRSKAKCLINRYFNIGKFITTIWGANINLGIPQCKNY